MTLPVPDPDRDKTTRVLRAVPQDAAWIRQLALGTPLRRVPTWLAEDVFRALDQIRADDVDFLAPALVAAHQAFVGALDHLADELGGMFDPEREDADYFEVPPEWKSTQHEQYYAMLSSLDSARTGFLTSYRKLINTMNHQGKLPSETQPSGTPPKVEIRTGDNSPVNYYAPQANASHGGTADARVTVNPSSTDQAATDADKSFWASAKLIGILTAVLVILGVITVWPILFPSK